MRVVLSNWICILGEYLLDCPYSSLSFAITLGKVWTAYLVVKTINVSKFKEIIGGELWTIVGGQFSRDSVSGLKWWITASDDVEVNFAISIT